MRSKERFLIRRNRTKHAIFQGKPLFQATYNRKQLNQVILCLFDARRLVGGKRHETAWCEKEKGLVLFHFLKTMKMSDTRFSTNTNDFLFMIIQGVADQAQVF